MRNQSFLIGIDLGTQSVRALLLDDEGKTVSLKRKKTPVNRINENSAEYDPEALWQVVLLLIKDVVRDVPPGSEIVGISCASMGETCFMLDAEGNTLAPAMVWFDRRTEADANTILSTVGARRLFEITGYPADPTLSLCKILWFRRHHPDLFKSVKMILPVSSWIAFRLSGVAAVDYSLASRTLCLDVNGHCWSEELLAAFDLSVNLLPPILPSGSRLGTLKETIRQKTNLPGCPVVAVGAQDHICGGFVAGATHPGILLDSVGTSEALLLTTDSPLISQDQATLGYVQTTASLGQPFCLIGSGLNRSGGSVEWALQTIAKGCSREQFVKEAALEAAGSNGVCFLPHLAYSSAPHPDTSARGAFVGLTDATGRPAIFRSILEGIAFEARLIIDTLASFPEARSPNSYSLIGGGTKNELLMKIKASVLGCPLIVFDEAEMTAIGAAVLGGIAAGLWKNFDEASSAISLPKHICQPVAEWVPIYGYLYEEVYKDLFERLLHINRSITALPFDRL